MLRSRNGKDFDWICWLESICQSFDWLIFLRKELSKNSLLFEFVKFLSLYLFRSNFDISYPRSFHYSKLFLFYAAIILMKTNVFTERNIISLQFWQSINSPKKQSSPCSFHSFERNFVSFDRYEFLRNACNAIPHRRSRTRWQYPFKATDLSYHGRVVPVACLQARKPVPSVGRDYRSHWYMVSSNLVYRGDSARTEVRSKQ